MKTAISIPDPLFREVERLARRLGLSRSETFQRAVAAFVQTHRAACITDTLDQVYSENDDQSRLDPILHRMQVASLPEGDW
jgi:predicted transcriptional regulator